ncbi:kynureninase [Phaeocystidibacter luteus]|uniref:Kynureninase n=1 Tax=Phaeocystidibacter luteus TaxID=911197 RepID=A0A6N6RGL2_9FLAO|nr:kynureninase [Phaeocystidibacter luteus]KAB2810306.1 kynureninase [Phaeocystidibacter luteus]
MSSLTSRDFALQSDANDSLSSLRQKFHIPQHNGADVMYFTGNSLGLQPVDAKKYIDEELEDWKNLGVEGHVHARRPWMPYHENFTKSLARLVGSKPEEVVAIGTLTNNLHLLMVSFYRPTESRFKILCEAKAFPSDQYALASQARFHGFDPKEAIIEVSPREGEHTIREEDIHEIIEREGDSIAMMMIGGVNYYTGQVFDMNSLTKFARAKGITVGWDLAHGIGNIELKLHEWDVDFAAWCSYKYLNSGPGSIAGIYIHERHHGQRDIPRFEGWWGHDKGSRFAMPDQFEPIPTAEAWQLSNVPVLAMAAHRASLDLFDHVDLAELRARGRKLSNYLREVLLEVAELTGREIEIITPANEAQSGCQVSVLFPGLGKDLFDKLLAAGVIADWREPHVIRMAPVPMYSSFEDIYRFGETLLNVLKEA